MSVYGRKLRHVIKSQCDINEPLGSSPPALLSQHAALRQYGFMNIIWVQRKFLKKTALASSLVWALSLPMF